MATRRNWFWMMFLEFLVVLNRAQQSAGKMSLKAFFDYRSQAQKFATVNHIKNSTQSFRAMSLVCTSNINKANIRRRFLHQERMCPSGFN